MEKRIILIVLITGILITNLWAIKRSDEPSIDKKLYENYLLIKNALVASNPKKVKASAEKMLSVINEAEKVKDKNTSPFLLKAEVEKLSLSNGLDDQRIIFSSLSEKVYSLIKNKSIGNTSYYQHCPMALNNKGAFWISEGSEIFNPYFGNQMPKCGSTKEVIQSK